MSKTGISSTLLLFCCLGVSFGQRCGRSDNSTRIVGGQPTKLLQWPWMALLRITLQSSRGVAQCGGSLISDQWVLTAAHCVNGQRGRIEVILGEHDTRRREGRELRLSATNVYLNSFNQRTNANDIALLKLSQRVNFTRNSYLQPICLQSSDLGIDSNKCFATGWGRTSDNGPTSSVLREVKLPIVDSNTCRSIWRNVFSSERQVCAGYREGGHDTCQGDSGGPLNCQLANGVWILQGITSFGTGCAQAYRPGVYTRVSAYLPWIRSTTGLKF